MPVKTITAVSTVNDTLTTSSPNIRGEQDCSSCQPSSEAE